jgi:hypothetical protein
MSNKVIPVCGRIAPEQVHDYVSKIRRNSNRSEIAVVKFISGKDDLKGYEAFFEYLNSRGRYGVVDVKKMNIKQLKDFYILPLAKNKEEPKVLLPFSNGPGLEKRLARPNLLLGILVRVKQTTNASSGGSSMKAKNSFSHLTSSTSSKGGKAGSSSSRSGVSSGGQLADRSYTPPPKMNQNATPDGGNEEDDDGNYTPPRDGLIASSSSSSHKTKSSLKAGKADDGDEPYDPEDLSELSNSNDNSNSNSNSNLTSSSTNHLIHHAIQSTSTSSGGNESSYKELMNQIANSSDPIAMSNTVLKQVASSSNIDLQRRLLDQLNAKVEEQKRQLEIEKKKAEERVRSTTSIASTTSSSSGSWISSGIPGLDGQFLGHGNHGNQPVVTTTSSAFDSSIANIKIPDNLNLQEILSNVNKGKTQESRSTSGGFRGLKSK